MMIHKIIPTVDYNLWLKRLDIQLNEPTNQNSLKVPKVVKSTNKKMCYKTFETREINNPMSPPSLTIATEDQPN